MLKNKLTFIPKIIVFSILSFISCNGQKTTPNQKENIQTKSSAPSVINEDTKHKDDLTLNQYISDKKDGLWKKYYKNGQLKSEGNYMIGLKEGLHKEWGDNGVLLSESPYSKGKVNGWTKWYHEKGHLAGEGNIIDDKRVGPWRICDIEENGFCIDAFFKDDKRDGIWKIYHQNNEDKLWKEQTFKEDRMIFEKCWDVKGKEIVCE